MKIEPTKKNGDIIMVVGVKPTITIELNKDEKCTLIGLKICHCGNAEEDKFEENPKNFFKLGTSSYQYDPTSELINNV